MIFLSISRSTWRATGRCLDMFRLVRPRVLNLKRGTPGNLFAWWNASGRLRSTPAFLTTRWPSSSSLGIMLSHGLEPAHHHAVAARRLGASWEELHKVVELAFHIGGMGAAQLGCHILSRLEADEAGTAPLE